jgi:hypothetical protein
MLVNLKRWLNPIGNLNDLRQTLLYVNLVDLYATVEHDEEVLVRV